MFRGKLTTIESVHDNNYAFFFNAHNLGDEFTMLHLGELSSNYDAHTPDIPRRSVSVDQRAT